MIPITGNPDPRLNSTSHIERRNLTMRMQLRRFTRLTNAFSKKLVNLKAALALHFAYYNCCRMHSSLRVTPAMVAGMVLGVGGVGELGESMAEHEYIVTVLCFACSQCHSPIPHYYQLPMETASEEAPLERCDLECTACHWKKVLSKRVRLAYQ